jgi:C_GCAxxG_C_C family probable redox protein
MQTKTEIMMLADKFIGEGYLCSESVLLSLNEYLKIQSEIIPKIATGFGAGIGRHGEVCGALSGAVMGLGLRFGRTIVSETPPDTSPYAYSTEIVNLFVTRFGHIRCRDLLGLDLRTEKDRRTYKDQQVWETRCREIVRITTGLAYDLFQAKDPDSKD